MRLTERAQVRPDVVAEGISERLGERIPDRVAHHRELFHSVGRGQVTAVHEASVFFVRTFHLVDGLTAPHAGADDVTAP